MAPGYVLAIAVVAGATAGAATGIPAVEGVALAVASFSFVLVSRPGRARRVCAALVASGLALAHAASDRDAALVPELPAELVDSWDRAGLAGPGPPSLPGGPIVVLEGRLKGDARMGPDGQVRLLVDARRVLVGREWYPVGFRVQAFVGGDRAGAHAADWVRGRIIRVPVALRQPQVLRNPGGASPRRQALLRGYHFAGSIKSALLVELVDRGPWPSEWAAAVRRRVRTTTRELLGPTESGAIVAAILIGDRTGLRPETTERLQRAGTYHVIAISGGNVAMVAAAALFLARLLVRSYRVAAVSAAAAVVTYGWIVGAEPSVVRATTAAAIYLAASAAGLTPSVGHVFALVAALVAAADPLATVQPGAWLSYGATLGILALASYLVAPLPRADGRGSRAGRLVGPILIVGGRLLAATVAAELVLWPISAWLFARVGAAGLLLNIVAIPSMAVVQGAGAAAVGLFGWWDWGAGMAAALARAAVRVLVDSARLVDVVPWLSWRVPPPEPAWVVVFYAALVTLWCGWPQRRVRRVAAPVAGLALAGLLSSPDLSLARPADGWMRVTMLDVGQGEAIVVQFPHGRTLLVDAGASSQTYDVGDRVVSRALWALGVRSLDWAAVTHPDLDHIGGMAAVVDAFAPHEIWEGVPVEPDADRQRLQDRTREIPWRQIRAGDRLTIGPVIVDGLHPTPPDWERQQVRNDDSLVLRLRYGECDVLLTGDAGVAVERFLPIDPAVPLRVLKVGHHGSRTSTGGSFVAAYRPTAALVSVGAGNSFGHPAPEVVTRLEGSGARVFRTDRDGALSVETDGRQVVVRSWSGRVWRARVWRAVP